MIEQDLVVQCPPVDFFYPLAYPYDIVDPRVQFSIFPFFLWTFM